MPTPSTIARSTAATPKYGTILPRNTSRGRSGITASCSSVPDCRSRTTPRLVMIVPMKTSTTPARPGIITSEVDRPGLYRIVTSGCSEPRLLPAPPSLLSAASVASAVNSWLPSMSTAGRPLPVSTTATAAWPSRNWSSAHWRPCTAAAVTTSKGLGRTELTAAASRPATATGIERTSKLAA